LDRRIDGHWSRSGSLKKREISFPCLEPRFLGRSSRSSSLCSLSNQKKLIKISVASRHHENMHWYPCQKKRSQCGTRTHVFIPFLLELSQKNFNCSVSKSGLAMAPTLWTPIRELPDSNLGWESNHPDFFCVCISSLPPGERLDCLDHVTTVSFRIHKSSYRSMLCSRVIR
jgi:hypothetical protein